MKMCPYSMAIPGGPVECIGDKCTLWVNAVPLPKEALSNPQMRSIIENFANVAGIENGVVKAHCYLTSGGKS